MFKFDTKELFEDAFADYVMAHEMFEDEETKQACDIAFTIVATSLLNTKDIN